MAEVTLDKVVKQYPNGFRAVDDLDLEIEEGEFLVMVGPSGCGKSTTLRMIAGLEEISSGELRIDNEVVNDLHPKDRDIAMVFQNYALYPHMTVFDNIAFALKLERRPKQEIKERVGDAARVLELDELLDRKPGQLSGGQRQRVAMGRAIVRRPKVFLLDEPLSNLDAKLRVQMRAEITDLQRQVGVTTFYVTHDQVEAMTMADRVAVIKAGILQQVDAPQVLFDHPNNLFTAAFIGSPSMNLMEGQLDENGDGLTMTLGSNRLATSRDVLDQRPALRNYIGRKVVIGLRPKEFEDAAVATDSPESTRVKGIVENVEALGYERMVYFDLDAKPVIDEEALEVEGDVPLHQDVTRVCGRFDPTSRVRVADTIDIVVRTENAHYFDIDTGEAIRG